MSSLSGNLSDKFAGNITRIWTELIRLSCHSTWFKIFQIVSLHQQSGDQDDFLKAGWSVIVLSQGDREKNVSQAGKLKWYRNSEVFCAIVWALRSICRLSAMRMRTLREFSRDSETNAIKQEWSMRWSSQPYWALSSYLSFWMPTQDIEEHEMPAKNRPLS